jgi:hypothetical protein
VVNAVSATDELMIRLLSATTRAATGKCRCHGLDPRVLLARSDPDELSDYLREQQHPNIEMSRHLFGADSLVLFIATNFPILE